MFITRKPLLEGVRVEQPLCQMNWLDRSVLRVWSWVQRSSRILTRSDQRFAVSVVNRSEQFSLLSDEHLVQQRLLLLKNLRTSSIDRKLLIDVFALIREVSGRTLGMRHHTTQIRASLCLLRGDVAEMATGEGKTLAATLACSAAALSGIPVHVVTVNDYLAERDAEEMQPLYEALGLKLGIVIHGMEMDQRRQAYAADITYCSNKELVFDFLKDRIVLGSAASADPARQIQLLKQPELKERLMQRGLHFAIVDEADSIFIDEARTPLIISGAEKFGVLEEQIIIQAMTIAKQLEQGLHFNVSEYAGIQLTPKGEQAAEALSRKSGGLWLNLQYREQLVSQALSAWHRYQCNRDYIVNEDNEVQIVDPYTGRVTPGRSWGQGLHQMIEFKEQLELTRPRETDSEISYQNFFRKYASLAGMTGTGIEVKKELLDVFRISCTSIPQLQKNRRRLSLVRIYKYSGQKYKAIAEQVERLHRSLQPVLVGTASVKASEDIAAELDDLGLEYKLLNARQDKQEAEVVASAGQAGAITIATGMAGRGTDIKLTRNARTAGGLHVIITELQDASRIDRQFYGRSARQGDPGEYSLMLSLEDQLLIRLFKPSIRGVVTSIAGFSVWRNWLGYWLLRGCQLRLERLHRRQRMELIESDIKRQRMLSFAGKSEYSL